MDTCEAGKKGGASKSAAKVAAVRRNLELARAARALKRARALYPKVVDEASAQWLRDAERIHFPNEGQQP